MKEMVHSLPAILHSGGNVFSMWREVFFVSLTEELRSKQLPNLPSIGQSGTALALDSAGRIN